MPLLDAGCVVRDRWVTDGIGDLNDAVGMVFDIALADLLTEPDKIAFVLALVQEEEDVDQVQRFDGLHGDIVRIAGHQYQ